MSKQMFISTNGMTRRINVLYLTPAEKAINDAFYEIEKLGADVRLTDAGILLQKAKDLVSDVIDERLTEDK